MPINVLVKGKKRRSYWIPSPLGGYMEVPWSEVEAWIENGTARLYVPDRDAIEKLRQQLHADVEDAD